MKAPTEKFVPPVSKAAGSAASRAEYGDTSAAVAHGGKVVAVEAAAAGMVNSYHTSAIICPNEDCKCTIPSGFTICVSCRCSFLFEQPTEDGPDPQFEETVCTRLAKQCLRTEILRALARTAKFKNVSGGRSKIGECKRKAREFVKYLWTKLAVFWRRGE